MGGALVGWSVVLVVLVVLLVPVVGRGPRGVACLDRRCPAGAGRVYVWRDTSVIGWPQQHSSTAVRLQLHLLPAASAGIECAVVSWVVETGRRVEGTPVPPRTHPPNTHAHTPPSPPMQARASCGTRYLGARATNCTNTLVALYNKADASALTLWELK